MNMESSFTLAAPSARPPRRRPGLGVALSLTLCAGLLLPAAVRAEEKDWSIGFYGGQYYDSEPAGFSQGRANYLNQYIVAITASKTVWRAKEWPLSLEIDGMVGHQFGQATLQEFAIAPVVRWSGFPWNSVLPTSVRAGPLGYSYNTKVSPLERGPGGEGTRHLNFLMLELAFSSPKAREHEVFLRLHHRCTIYDLLNNYGANGQDYVTLGYRRFF
ncbi:MAG: hypothetical protein Q8R72_02330 [Hylemonella sp.]|nr:hypothetical protein [Hylemonella sp.]